MGTPDKPTPPPAVTQDRISLLAERYRLLHVIGRGAMASVYRAVDETLGREVAVKLFLPGSGDDEFRMRQETEMRLLAGFDHPGLVSLYDAGTDLREPDAQRAFLVMEFVPGANLRTRLDEGPLNAAEAACVGECLAGALAQVHSNGVIHRDIKPANILLPEAGIVAAKLADFGVARIVDGTRLTATGMTVGTASYLSPEQAMGRQLTTASDIYSLGLVLIECLSGQPEYPGTPMESAAARLHRAPSVPSSLPPAYAALLTAMTDLDPHHRPTAEEVAGSLAGVLGAFDASATAPTRTIPELPDRQPASLTTAKLAATRRTRRRHRKRLHATRRVAAVVALLAATAIIAPVIATEIQDGGQQPVSGSTATTTTGTTPSPTPGISSGSATPTDMPTPATVGPTPVPTTPAPSPTDLGVNQAGNGSGKDNGRGKNH